MADYAIPATMKYYSTNGPHSVTYTVVASHTAVAPHLVIFDRKVPVVNADGSEVYAQYRVRVIRAVLDGEGNPTGKKSTVEFTARYPSDAVAANVTADLASLGTMLSDTDFQQDVAVELLLPH